MLAALTSNNPKTQEFAYKAGAHNLAIQYDREVSPKLQEAVLNALASYLKGNNFPGKRVYIADMNGYQQLARELQAKDTDRKVRVKLVQILNDFVLNDDSILDFGFRIRNELTADLKTMTCLTDIIKNSDVKNTASVSLREFVLNIFMRIYQRETTKQKRAKDENPTQIMAQIDEAIQSHE